MAIDFRDAAERHWEDAEYLWADTRLANADQLYGLAAECALKAVMLGLGMNIDPATGKPEYPYHINRLWDEFVTFAHNRRGAHYASLVGTRNPFANWDISQRYHHRSAITQHAAEEHKRGAATGKAALDNAILDGVVS